MPIYNYMLDVAFEVESPCDNWWDIPIDVLTAALKKRADSIQQDKFGKEAFSFCDVFEVEDEQNNTP